MAAPFNVQSKTKEKKDTYEYIGVNDGIRYDGNSSVLIKHSKWIILGILFGMYSIIAFIIDFKRALGLFVMEMIIVVICGIKLLNKYCIKDKWNIENAFDSRWIKIIGYVILIGGVIGFTVLFTYRDPIRLFSVVGLFCFIAGSYLFRYVVYINNICIWVVYNNIVNIAGVELI